MLNILLITAGGSVRKSGVKVEFSDIGFHVMCRGDLTDEEQDEMLDFLYERTTQQERQQLRQLVCTYKVSLMLFFNICLIFYIMFY